MATSKPESTILDWAADLSRRLGKKGSSLEALARAAAKPSVLSALVRLTAQDDTVDLPNDFPPIGVSSLLKHLFGNWDTWYNWVDMDDSDRARQNEIARYLNDPTLLRQLFEVLSPRYRTIIALTHGLVGGRKQSEIEIAERFRVSSDTISAQLKKAADQLRAAHAHRVLIESTSSLPVYARPLETLDLSSRAYHPFRQSKPFSDWDRRASCINTIGELCCWTAEDLLKVSGIGQKVLDEIIAKLTVHHLTLRSNIATPLGEGRHG